MSTYPPAEPAAAHLSSEYAQGYGNEKGFTESKTGDRVGETHGGQGEYDVQEASTNPLHRDLKSRHMQMIAIGESSRIEWYRFLVQANR